MDLFGLYCKDKVRTLSEEDGHQLLTPRRWGSKMLCQGHRGGAVSPVDEEESQSQLSFNFLWVLSLLLLQSKLSVIPGLKQYRFIVSVFQDIRSLGIVWLGSVQGHTKLKSRCWVIVSSSRAPLEKDILPSSLRFLSETFALQLWDWSPCCLASGRPKSTLSPQPLLSGPCHVAPSTGLLTFGISDFWKGIATLKGSPN